MTVHRIPLTMLFFNFLFFVLPASQAYAQFSIDAEVGYIFSIPYNEVRIPASGGTEFDLANDLSAETTFAFRARLNYTIGERHVISALYAPLTIKSSGQLNSTLVYSDQTFPANTPIDAEYKFNSYRLTYRYLIVRNEKIVFGLGLTGKVRDANITVASADASADFPDLGFVPLINFYFNYTPIEKFSVLIEGDALGTKQGRAEDIFAGLTYTITNPIRIKAGYRVLEGGADVERNYNFSWINYAVVGVVIDLNSYK